LGPNVDNS